MIAIGKDKNMDMSKEGMEPDQMEESPMETMMESSIPIPQGVYEDAQDGDEVTTQVSGTLMIGEDGKKHLMVKQVEGKNINETEEQVNPQEEAGEAIAEGEGEPENVPSQGIESAKAGLMAAIKSKGGYNNAA